MAKCTTFNAETRIKHALLHINLAEKFLACETAADRRARGDLHGAQFFLTAGKINAGRRGIAAEALATSLIDCPSPAASKEIVKAISWLAWA